MKWCSVVAVWLGAVLTVAAAPVPLHVFAHENVLGSSLELKLAAPTAAVAQQAEAAALAELDRVTRVISTYDPASDYSRWFATSQQPVKVAPELLEVFALYDHWRAASSGAFEAGAEAVTALWKTAAARQQLPTVAELAAAASAACQPHWQLDRAAGTVTHLSRTPLSFNAAGKGYLLRRLAAAALAVPGVTGVVVNLGGDLVVRGALTEPVAVTNPRDAAENAAPLARLLIRDGAVATSGDYRRGVDIAGRHYSHLVDPRTGLPVTAVISATAIAPDVADADALATIFSVLPPAASLRLAESLPGVACLLVTETGERLVSRGWKMWEAPVQLAALGDVPLPSGKPAPGAWDARCELTVSLELARLTEGRARRPFVAVWIEDADQFPVRTLALWYNGSRWLPDLRSWYQAEQLRALAESTNLIASVSSATRVAGKYSFKWDGRDNAGHPVKAGKYTVLIEVAREHGTHQLLRHEVDFSGTPHQFTWPANVELAAAALDYHRRSAAP